MEGSVRDSDFMDYTVIFQGEVRVFNDRSFMGQTRKCLLTGFKEGTSAALSSHL